MEDSSYYNTTEAYSLLTVPSLWVITQPRGHKVIKGKTKSVSFKKLVELLVGNCFFCLLFCLEKYEMCMMLIHDVDAYVQIVLS